MDRADAVAGRFDPPMAWLKPGSANRILRDADALAIQNWWQPANLRCAWLGRRRNIPFTMYVESALQSRRFARGPLAWLRLSRTHTLVLPSTEEVYGFTALGGYVAGPQVIVSSRAGIAPNLAGKAGAWIVEPTPQDIGRALGEARDGWNGRLDDVDVDFASPRRAAADIVRAAEIAQAP